MDSVHLKCQECKAVNKIIKDKLKANPKCGKCKALITYPHKPVNITSGSFQNDVLSDPGLVLLDFWSPSCGHCVRLNPVLDEIAAENAGVLKIVKINVQEDQHLATQFGVQGIPALFLFNNGKKINNTSGGQPKDTLLSWIFSSVN